MSRTTMTLDRIAVLVLALLLIALGLLAVAWTYDVGVRLPERIDLGGLRSVLAASWVPWVSALLGLLLVILGLRWLVGHLPVVARSTTRLRSSNADGRLQVDAASVASAAAAQLAKSSTFTESSGKVRSMGGRQVVELDVRPSARAELRELVEQAGRVSSQIEQAFPSGSVGCRVMVGSPRTRGRDRVRRQTAQVN